MIDLVGLKNRLNYKVNDVFDDYFAVNFEKNPELKELEEKKRKEHYKKLKDRDFPYIEPPEDTEITPEDAEYIEQAETRSFRFMQRWYDG